MMATASVVSVVVGGGGFTPPPYGYSIAAVNTAKAEGDSGTTTFTFIVTKFGDLTGATTVHWSVQPGSSAGTSTNIVNGADFGSLFTPGGDIDFAAGDTTKTLTVTLSGDTVAETDEQFTVILGNAGFTSATLPPDWAGSATATILNDDAAVSATYTLGWGTGGNLGPIAFVEQGDGVTPTTVNFTVTRSGDVSQAGSVDWSIVGSGAAQASAADFIGGVLPGGTVQFAAGEVTQTVLIPILNDFITEPTEGFQVLLSNPSAGTGVDVGVLDRTILDNDAVNGFAIVATGADKAEGQPGAQTPFVFTVFRSGDAAAAASVDVSVLSTVPAEYNPTNMIAVNAGDLVAGAPAYSNALSAWTVASQTVTFAPGEVSQTVTFLVNGDLLQEGDEIIGAALSNASAGMVLRNTVATGVVRDDEAAVPPSQFNVSIDNAAQAEGDSGPTLFTFTITRSGNLDYAGQVSWSAAQQPRATYYPGVQTSFTTSDPSVLQFAAGQASETVTLAFAGDQMPEPDVGFSFSLLSPSPGSTVGAPLSFTVLNDDVVTQPTAFAIAAADAVKAEGNSGTTDFTFTVTRAGDTSLAGAVAWSASWGPDLSHTARQFDFPSSGWLNQYYMPAGTVNFAPGESSQTLTIQVAGDTEYEPDEQFVVTLSSPSYGSSIDAAHDSATAAILNDDAPPVDYTGTSGNNTISYATATTDKRLDLSQGGSDTATGGSANDTFLLGATLNSTDKINGAGGSDTLALNGNYAAGITLGNSTVTSVETFVLAAGNSYLITTNSATVASGATLTVDATALGSVNSANINGSSETNGGFVFLGGAGNDVFTGGSGADLFVGGAGADMLKGNSGADVFRYLTGADSPFGVSLGAINTSVIDIITSFQAGTDKLDLGALHLGDFGRASLVTKSTSAFSTGTVNGAGFFGTAGVAVEQASLNRVTTTRVYVDVNHDGNLGSGDLLIQMTGVSKGAFGASSIVF